MQRAIPAGALGTKVRLQNYAISKSRYGEEGKAWTPGLEVWAAIRNIAPSLRQPESDGRQPESDGREVFEAAQLRYRQTREIEIRYYTPLDTTWRVELDGRYWDILDIQEVGRKAGMRLTIEIQK